MSDSHGKQHEIGAYEHSGRGCVAREPELEKRFETYEVTDHNPQRTAEEKEHIKRIEAEKEKIMEAHGHDTDPPAKKGGIMGKLESLLPGKHGKDKDDETVEEELERSETARAKAREMGYRTDENGNIIIKNTSLHPDDPAIGVNRSE